MSMPLGSQAEIDNAIDEWANLGLSEADLPKTYENSEQGLSSGCANSPASGIADLAGPEASLHLKSGVVTISPPRGGWQVTLDIWRATEALSYVLRAHALPPQRKGPPLVLTSPNGHFASS